ncbi:hypothetical protein [Geofilum rubicundum]|uniref:hypothetical protein n=1 Tax=Geofilum rubicundum TaxID=472113 RepID=UPI001D0E70F4|nr:hypothetical protein [Geofilum rubicundum]
MKYWLLPMAIAMNLPNLVYVYLAHALPESIWLISSAVAWSNWATVLALPLRHVYDLLFGREKQDRPLRHFYGLHGHGDDATGHDFRVDSGNDRLWQLLYLGGALYDTGLFYYKAFEN